jgi:hypothetical protein
MTLGCAAAGAHAESFFHAEAGLGATNFTAMGDGMYYQQGFSHHLKLRVPAGRIGVGLTALPYTRGSWLPGVDLNLSYMYFGTAKIQGDAVPDASDYTDGVGGYNPQKQACNGTCGPMRYFDTGGSLQAIALTIEPYYEVGNWRFSVEGGPAVFKGTWTSTMTVMSETSPWGPRGSVETLAHDPKPQLTWVAGASVAYKKVTVRYTYISTPSKNVSNSNVPLGFRAAHMVTLGYRW